jgi:hypothetical protein
MKVWWATSRVRLLDSVQTNAPKPVVVVLREDQYSVDDICIGLSSRPAASQERMYSIGLFA